MSTPFPGLDPVLVAAGAAAIAEQTAEYSRWVANQDIFVGNALAYRTGDPVPASNVARFGYDQLGMVDPRQPEPDASSVQTDAPTPAEVDEPAGDNGQDDNNSSGQGEA